MRSLVARGTLTGRGRLGGGRAWEKPKAKKHRFLVLSQPTFLPFTTSVECESFDAFLSKVDQQTLILFQFLFNTFMHRPERTKSLLFEARYRVILRQPSPFCAQLNDLLLFEAKYTIAIQGLSETLYAQLDKPLLLVSCLSFQSSIIFCGSISSCSSHSNTKSIEMTIFLRANGFHCITNCC